MLIRLNGGNPRFARSSALTARQYLGYSLRLRPWLPIHFHPAFGNSKAANAPTQRTYPLRVGDYRVIHEVFESKLVIEIVRVRHRKDAYRE